MYVVTPEEMRKIDSRAINSFGIPGIVLMENAALQVYRVIKQELSKAGSKSDKALVLCGLGNNGGDGLAVARQLHLDDIQVEVVLLKPSDRELTGDALTNLRILEKLGVQINIIATHEKLEALKSMAEKADIVVDALFGTGLDRPVEGIYMNVIDIVNESEKPVVSIDIPSGIDGRTGANMGAAIKAAHTVTFGYPKIGQLLYPGREFCGILHVVPISLPDDSHIALNIKSFTLDDRETAVALKRRPVDGHKGTFGSVGIIAGSTGLTGAAFLTAEAALKSGAGLVTLGIPASLNPILECKLTEAMTVPLSDAGTGILKAECIDEIYKMAESKDALAVGPGLSVDEGIFHIIRDIIMNVNKTIVLDADGINNISMNSAPGMSQNEIPGDEGSVNLHPVTADIFASRKGDIVITPHPGEMARLTGKSIKEILRDPISIAGSLAQKYNIIVLLKGASTVVAAPDGRIYINRSGNSGMATGGSGDVLSGIIASLAAQGYNAFDAVVYGCYIHGSAGDLASSKKGEISMTARDIVNFLPETFNALYKSSL